MLFKSNLARTVFYLGILVAISIGGFYIYGLVSSGGISVDISADGNQAVGKPFDLKVNFSNNSRNILNESEISLKIPDGVVLISGNGEKVITRQLGQIDVGAIHQEIFRVMATPLESPTREFGATLSYSPGSISARFKKNNTYILKVSPIGVQLDLVVPEKVFSGEEFETAVSYKVSDSDGTDTSQVSLKMVYPDKFTKTREETKDDGTNAKKTTIKGKVDFPDDASFEMKAQIITNLMGNDYVVTEKTAKVLISASPLSLTIALNGKTDGIVSTGDTLSYSLSYKNNTPVDLQDILIKARLTGEMFDLSSLNGNGAKFNNFEGTLVWDSATFSDQMILKPGEGKSVSFSAKVKANFPIRKLNDKNFTLKVDARIESPTVPYLISADKTVNRATLETKVSGMVGIDSHAYFRDAVSGILNKGLWPPKVGTPTQFTVHLLITNFASDIKDIEVKASLMDGVTFTGIAKSNTSTAPEFNSEAGEVVWKIDRLVATTGITGEKPEAIFQVEANPTIDKKGSYMPIISAVAIKAHDEFTEREIINSAPATTTRLPDDSSVAEGQGIIVE